MATATLLSRIRVISHGKIGRIKTSIPLGSVKLRLTAQLQKPLRAVRGQSEHEVLFQKCSGHLVHADGTGSNQGLSVRLKRVAQRSVRNPCHRGVH